MKKAVSLVRTVAVPMAVVLAALGLGAVSHAANTTKKVNAEKMTCEDFLALGEEVQPHVVYWLDGYSKSGKLEDSEVDIDAFQRPIAMVVTECHKAPKASLLEKIKAYF
jgi:acid stress chaperone HdeA